MKNGFSCINPSTGRGQPCVLCVSANFWPPVLQSPSQGSSGWSWLAQAPFLLLFLGLHWAACAVQQNGFCIHRPTLRAQRRGLAAEEIHWQAWGVSEPTAGLLLSSYKTRGTWRRTEVTSQKTPPAFWRTVKEIPPVNWEAVDCCSLSLPLEIPLLSSQSLRRLGSVSLWTPSSSLACRLSFLKQSFRSIT